MPKVKTTVKEKKKPYTRTSSSSSTIKAVVKKGRLIRPRPIYHDGLTSVEWNFKKFNTRIVYICNYFGKEEADVLLSRMLHGDEKKESDDVVVFEPERGFRGNPPTHHVAWRGSHSWQYAGRTPFPPLPLSSEWGIKLVAKVQSTVHEKLERPKEEKTEEKEKETRPLYTGALFNLYRDGQDSLTWHSDDEAEITPDSTIASLTFGGEREFHVMNHAGTEYDHPHDDVKETKRLTRAKLDSGVNIDVSPTVQIILRHGSLLLMMGSCQRFMKHCVPKLHTTRLGRDLAKKCGIDLKKKEGIQTLNASFPPRVNITLRDYLPHVRTVGSTTHNSLNTRQ